MYSVVHICTVCCTYAQCDFHMYSVIYIYTVWFMHICTVCLHIYSVVHAHMYIVLYICIYCEICVIAMVVHVCSKGSLSMNRAS